MLDEVDEDEQRERGGADDERREVGVLDDFEERADLLDDALAMDLGARDLAELADDHEHGAAGEVADEERLTQQLGDDAQPEDSGDKTPQGDDEAECGGKLHGLVLIAGRERGDGGAGHQGDGGFRAHREQAGLAHHGIHDERREGGPEADHGWHVDDGAVGHHLGDQIGDDRDAGEDVRA